VLSLVEAPVLSQVNASTWGVTDRISGVAL